MGKFVAVVVMLVLGVMLGPPAAAAAADVGSFPDGTTAEAAREGDTVAVFPITLGEDVTRGAVRVRVVTVRRDGVSSKALRRALEATYVRWVPAVRLVLDDPRPRAGEYEVVIKLSQGRRSQVVTFTLTRPGAEVTYPAAVEVTREESWRVVGALDWLGDLTRLSPTDEPEIVLRGGPDDDLAPGDFSLVETGTSPGSVTGSFVERGGAVELEYTLEGMPLGSSTHALEIRSPKLAEPLTVSLTVENRRPLVLIALVTILGLLAGHLLRNLVDPLLTRLRARIELSDLQGKLEDDLEQAKAQGDDGAVASLSSALMVTKVVPPLATERMIRRHTAGARQLSTKAAGPQASPGPLTKFLAEHPIVKALFFATFYVLLGVFRFVLLATVLIVLAFALWGDTWYGTWQQLLAVLSWAFALNVTTAAVQGELAKPGTPDPA